MIEVGSLFQHRTTLIGRCHLIGRHTSEDGVGPTCFLTSFLLELRSLLSCAHTGRGIMTIQDAPVYVSRHKIHERDNRKHDHC